MEQKRSDRTKTICVSEEMLFRLFDYQRFEDDPQLQSLIDGVESTYGAELSDDELIQVSAAGELYHKKRTDGGGGGAT